MSSLPELMHDGMESVMLFRRVVPNEVLSGLHDVFMKHGILLICNFFEYSPQQRNVVVGDDDGKLGPIQDVLPGEVVVVGNHDGNTAVEHGVTQSRRVNFEAFGLQTELAGHQALRVWIWHSPLVDVNLVVLAPHSH